MIDVLHQNWYEPDLYQTIDVIFVKTANINIQLHSVNTILYCLRYTVTLELCAHDSK